MKITKSKLKQIIKEELEATIEEGLTPAGERWLAKKRSGELKAQELKAKGATPEDLDKIAATLAERYTEVQKTWAGKKAKAYPGQGPIDRIKKVVKAADEKGDMTAVRMLTAEHYNIGHDFKKAGVHGSHFVELARQILEKALK